MKVLHIVHSIDKKMGGSVYAIQNIVALEKSAGIESHILTLDCDGADEELMANAVIHIEAKSFPKRLSRSRFASSWLKDNVTNFDLTVIHSIWGFHQLESAYICHSMRCPYIVWPHGSLDPFDLTKKKLIKYMAGPFFVNPMLRNSRCIVCTSRTEMQLLRSFGPRADLCIDVLPLPIAYRNLDGSRDRFRKRYGISEKQFVFLFLSRIDYKKGIELTLRSLRMIVNRGSSPVLVIAGSGHASYESKVKKMVKKLGLESNVIFAGFLTASQKDDAYVGADCYVLASLNENFGIAPVEALASGTPVLISNNVYIWEDLVDDKVGHVCEYNATSLVTEMHKCLYQSDSKLELALKAKSIAKKFSAERLSERYMKSYFGTRENNCAN